jgi:hypothetical protein
MDLLWNKINENKTPLGFYSAFTIAGMFFEHMKDSFDVQGDEFLNGRKKLIHTVGCVVKAEFVSTGDHPYTGVFEGSTQLLVRPSIASSANTSKTKAEDALGNFKPGMGLKFLRNGYPSANLQAMYSTSGQASWNFFKMDFSNHIPAAGGAALLAVALKFSSATDYIQTMGLRDLGLITEKGEMRNPPRYPFKLIFKPHVDLKNKYPDHFMSDYLDQLRSVPSGTTLYDVYAIEQPNQNEKKIGSIITRSNMVSSKWGDESMYFRHNYMDADINENPSWKKFVPAFSIFGSKVAANTTEAKSCPFLN